VPEGDSLHRAALRLRPLVGHRVSACSPNPRGLATGVATAVDGRVLESVEAVGKHLLLRFEGGVTVRSHLRMSGRWRIGPVSAERVGKPWLVLRAGDLEATQWNGPVLTLEQRPLWRLGPDLLGERIDAAALVARLRRADPATPLGVALQDQRLVAGIGNMWMSEALWAVRVSPWLTVGEAAEAQLTAALAWARDAMRGSVAGARPGRAVYRRAGRPCPRCATPIASRGQGDDNRTAYWCPACQGPAFVSGPDGKGMPRA
jgi:endonuclease VIII